MSKSKRYPVRVPRYATGIRMQETRGGARCWWARRWSEALEAMGLKGRMGRGRDYAVRGQVVSMEIEGSRVAAKVQGMREDPYAVTLDFRAPAGEHVVGGDRDEARAVAAARPRHVRGAHAVQAEGQLLVRLAVVHLRHRRAVDDGLGLADAKRLPEGIGAEDVGLWEIRDEQLVLRRKAALERAAEHALSACDEDLHGTSPRR